MENWKKHELFHSNNEVSWWHDMTHDNMSSHDIRHMTSRHDFMSIKFDIWLLLYVAVSELERWFYFCFARYLGREIHSYYRRLGDLHACIHAWPWNWRSRHGLCDKFVIFFKNHLKLAGRRSPVAGRRSPVADRRSPVPVADRRSPVAGRRSPVTSHDARLEVLYYRSGLSRCMLYSYWPDL